MTDAGHSGLSADNLSAGGPVRHGRIPKVVSKTFDPSTQACQHCRKRKRKCDRLTPACSNCVKAKISCVFDFRVTDKTHPGYVENLIKHGDELEARVKWLEDLVTALNPSLDIRSAPTNSVPTAGTPLTVPATSPSSSHAQSPSAEPAPSAITMNVHVPETSNLDVARMAKSVLGLASSRDSAPTDPTFLLDATPLGRLGGSTTSSSNHGSPATHDSRLYLPDYDDGLRMLEAYFNNNGPSYPMLERNQLKRELDSLYQDPNPVHPDRAQRLSIFRVCLVLAIGTTNIHDIPGGGAWSTSTAFYHRALQELDTVLEREDLECVQNLLLLCIFAVFNVDGPSLWQTLGFATRVAIGLGLHRRMGPERASINELERRRRTWWSLYNYDRVVSFTLIRPLSFADEDIDIELPSLDGDYGTGNPPYMYFTHHVIRQRRLAGIIMREVYSVAPNMLTDEARQTILSDIHGQIDNWYRCTPVPLSDSELPPGKGVGNTLYFSMMYNLLLCALYRPSPLFPTPGKSQLDTLFRASTRCLDAFWDLHRKKRIAVNHIHLLYMFTSAISLLYCLCEYGAEERNIRDVEWRRNTTSYVKSCRELLADFTDGWGATERYREIFQTLARTLVERCEVRSVPVLPPGPSILQQQQEQQRQMSSPPRGNALTSTPSSSSITSIYSEKTTSSMESTSSSDPGDVMQALWMHEGGGVGTNWMEEANAYDRQWMWEAQANNNPNRIPYYDEQTSPATSTGSPEGDAPVLGRSANAAYGTLGRMEVPPALPDGYRVFSGVDMDMSGAGGTHGGGAWYPAWDGNM
ncbi:hypothetical protein CYLTODRAFT_445242 [Cylindrobasidium torrendii FP15055 ss-10]|uniref:Zn(2)-C6 fungal-type domain-containing protein n=1 Tax=Cylindrobasidium torrendii FP15055 ss-10 TaxID=1314674 RepID=A0A0D7B5Z6_9AGAR|nr:hypothetical protein CYLTODRAFT_445242 [Cylindrobasidium torrendii FP15055 ss-10]